MVQTIHVDLGHTRYPIDIGPGLLGDRALLDLRLPGADLFVVSNLTVAPLYLPRLRAALTDRRLGECILADGERHKTLATAAAVLDALVEQRFNRDTTVIALGGGVVGDIGGFAAACYQRGVACVQMPTTLLAQVDSSVGGKTGVNHPGGKNLIGAFHQPAAVIADTESLATLPQRELRAGLAEVVKYGCIADAALFDWLERSMPRLLARDPEALTHAIRRSCELKASVVARDERESGLRAVLNFGHTFGHAIEAATGYQRYLHGEAVAIGMLIATDLSARLGLVDAPVLARLRALLGAAGLPLDAPRIGAAKARQLLQMDKKVLRGAVRLVLLAAIGRATVSADYGEEALERTLVEHFE
ncbi:MAG TPA: 3-dehydroquinate synthase [Steroidobacteraceae bacterium]|nr:3-dehydroquinate synthase [Steroidobacteraceae bacterium]